MITSGANVAAQAAVGAGEASRAILPRAVFVGSEEENYLRYLQTLGLVPLHQWSARGFGPRELDRLRPPAAGHPWSRDARLNASPIEAAPRVVLEAAPVAVESWYNSRFPYGTNDGAVWAGRGFTGAVRGGLSAAAGPISAIVAPTAFWSQNLPFDLMESRDTSVSIYNDPWNPTTLDRPQRFGPSGYGRIDPGQSALRVDAFGVTAGASVADQWWGPMSVFPYIIGNNAPGFARLFVGTSTPANVGVGRLHATVVYGRLEESPYYESRLGTRRFASGLVVVAEPRWFPGLELGGTRFFATPWPEGGPTRPYFTHLFETFLKSNIRTFLLPDSTAPNQSIDNQLASVFARWVLPRSGFEVYAEFGREDHSWDARDFMVQPDHSAGFGFGFRKAWLHGGRIDALMVELIDLETSTLARHRAEGLTYLHAYTPHGHTNRGQLLGSGFGAGSAAGAAARLERFTDVGRTAVTYVRTAVLDTLSHEVQQVVQVDRHRYWRGALVKGGVALVHEPSSYRGRDGVNWRITLGTEWRLGRSMRRDKRAYTDHMEGQSSQ